MSVCIDRADRFAGAIDEALAKGRTKKVNECPEEYKGPRYQFNEITQGARSVLKKCSGLPFPKTLILQRESEDKRARLALRSVYACQR